MIGKGIMAKIGEANMREQTLTGQITEYYYSIY